MARVLSSNGISKCTTLSMFPLPFEPGGYRSDVAAATVTPGEVAFAKRERLDHGVSALFRVRGIVSLLRFAAADVAAGGADAEIERGATTLAAIRARLCGRAVEMRTGWSVAAQSWPSL